jgi:hypothetical protein
MICVYLAHDEAQQQTSVLSGTHDKDSLDELNNYHILKQDLYIVLGS